MKIRLTKRKVLNVETFKANVLGPIGVVTSVAAIWLIWAWSWAVLG